MTSAEASRRRIKPALLALALLVSASACDSGNVAEVEQGQQSEELTTFLESPPKTVVSGAHKQADPHASLSAEKLLQVALQHLDEGRTELALETLNQAIGKYPGDGMLLSVRASIFLQQQQASLALADLNRAIELNPHDAILLTNRAQAYRQFGRGDEALRDLEGAIEIDPGSVAAHFNRGSMFFEQEKYDLALEDFNRCIELQPNVPAAWFNRASTHEALGRRAEAIGDLQRFLELEPDENWARVARDLLAQWDPEQS